MNTKLIGQFSAAIIIVLVLWMLSSFISSNNFNFSNVETVEDYVQYRESGMTSRTVSYFFTFLFTISIISLFVLLYRFCRIKYPEWAAIGIFFLPAYAALSILFYSAQVTVVPQLIMMYHQPEYQQAMTMLFSQFLPGTENIATRLASVPYFFLGITSVILGLILSKEQNKMLKIAGILTAVSGIGFLSGLPALFIRNTFITILGASTVIGFLGTLVLFCIIFLRQSSRDNVESSMNTIP
ncbi:hypothetical protein ACFL6G_07290 [candidate division KSB1 bacterium]